jgi:hypothetical protein
MSLIGFMNTKVIGMTEKINYAAGCWAREMYKATPKNVPQLNRAF